MPGARLALAVDGAGIKVKGGEQLAIRGEVQSREAPAAVFVRARKIAAATSDQIDHVHVGIDVLGILVDRLPTRFDGAWQVAAFGHDADHERSIATIQTPATLQAC